VWVLERSSLQADAFGRDDNRTPNVGYPTESTATYAAELALLMEIG